MVTIFKTVIQPTPCRVEDKLQWLRPLTQAWHPVEMEDGGLGEQQSSGEREDGESYILLLYIVRHLIQWHCTWISVVIPLQHCPHPCLLVSGGGTTIIGYHTPRSFITIPHQMRCTPRLGRPRWLSSDCAVLVDQCNVCNDCKCSDEKWTVNGSDERWSLPSISSLQASDTLDSSG